MPIDIYLDSASTTKPLNSVVDAIMPYITDKWQNPSSLYSAANKVKKDIEVVRKNIANCINANNDEIYFTSGSCESNNHVIRGFDDANYYNESVIITTPIEHKSIIDAVNNPVLRSDVHFCKVDSKGFVDMESLKYLLESNKNKQILVSIIFANNEIGTIQHLKEISDMVHSYNGLLHSDITQALAHIPIDVKKMGIDMASASAQKLGGLKGTGFLYKKNGIELRPLIYGEQERQLRGGTENVVGIIALGEAIKHINYSNNSNIIYLRDYFISELLKLGCTLNGDRHERLPNNINVSFGQNITGESMLYMLETAGILISTGSACNSHTIEPSHVLKAIGLSDEEAVKTIRITLPDNITKNDINKVVFEIAKSIALLSLN